MTSTQHTQHTPPSADLAAEIDVARSLLERASSVVLLAHVNPDADALGSALALGLALEHRGATAVVSFAEPDRVPDSLASLPGQHLVSAPADLPTGPDLVVTVDVGAADRLGSLRALLDSAGAVLVIDHHRTNTRFGTDHLIDPAAEATSVLVARLLDVMGAPIDADIAADLYAGLATDTVSFRHVTAGTHRLAARLVDLGVRPPDLMAPITDTHPFGWLDMLSTVLGRAVRVPGAAAGHDLVHAEVRLADAEGMRAEEIDSVIDIVRTTAGDGIAVVGKQAGPAHWQVSLRSGGVVDVAAVATLLGGGGHSRAAGFTHHGDYLSAIDRLREAMTAAEADGAAAENVGAAETGAAAGSDGAAAETDGAAAHPGDCADGGRGSGGG